jgi:hypothetical protein
MAWPFEYNPLPFPPARLDGFTPSPSPQQQFAPHSRAQQQQQQRLQPIWNASLNEFSGVMSPAEVNGMACYPSSTPYTYQASPAEARTALPSSASVYPAAPQHMTTTSKPVYLPTGITHSNINWQQLQRNQGAVQHLQSPYPTPPPQSTASPLQIPTRTQISTPVTNNRASPIDLRTPPSSGGRIAKARRKHIEIQARHVQRQKEAELRLAKEKREAEVRLAQQQKDLHARLLQQKRKQEAEARRIHQQNENARAVEAKRRQAQQAKLDNELRARQAREQQVFLKEQAEQHRVVQEQRLERERRLVRKEQLSKDPSALYRHYNEYLEYFPLTRGERRSHYHNNLLANRRMPPEPESDIGLAIQFAKDNWEWYLQFPRDIDQAIQWQREKLDKSTADQQPTAAGKKTAKR